MIDGRVLRARVGRSCCHDQFVVSRIPLPCNEVDVAPGRWSHAIRHRQSLIFIYLVRSHVHRTRRTKNLGLLLGGKKTKICIFNRKNVRHGQTNLWEEPAKICDRDR